MSSATAQLAAGEERRYFGTTKYGWRVVLFSGAGWFFDGYVINVWPLAIPFVMADLHLTVKDIGAITTIYVIAYTLGTLLGGTFSDYFGRRSVLSFSVPLYMFIDALTAVAQGFWSLGFFRFLTGTGTGMELPTGSTFIDLSWGGRRAAAAHDGSERRGAAQDPWRECTPLFKPLGMIARISWLRGAADCSLRSVEPNCHGPNSAAQRSSICRPGSYCFTGPN